MRRLRAVVVFLVVSGSIVAVGLSNAAGDPGDPPIITVSGTVSWAGERTIDAGKVLRFDPNVTTTLTVHGNLTIKGTLEMLPATVGVRHRLVFDTANENASQGTASTDVVPYTAPMTTDKGLWVLEGGVLDVEGSYREPWVHATTGLAAGQTTFTVDHSIQGWSRGDTLQVAPTALNDYAFEQVVIESVSGTTVTIQPAPAGQLTRAHPAVGIPGQAVATPEILNTTRNAQIWGALPNDEFPDASTQNNNGHGRAHILVNSDRPAQQTINFALIRYMGPRKYLSGIGGSRYVLGRYGIHFHKSGLFNDGSTVTGTVVLDSGSHAFVAHKSNGITFSKTIAYNDAETPYWWDVKANEESFLNNDETNRTTYSHTVAANIDTDPNKSSLRLAGYSASCGDNNVLADSVAINIQQTVQDSGIFWPEGANGCSNTWDVSDNVVHNSPSSGIFTWQNDTEDPHDLTNGFVAYRNAGNCLEHGAYRNAFQYSNVKCVANDGLAQVVSHAQGPGIDSPLNPQQMNDFTLNGTLVPLRIMSHTVSGGKPVELHRWTINSFVGQEVVVDESPDASRGRYDFICWRLVDSTGFVRNLLSTDFHWMDVHPGSSYRIQRLNSGGTDTMSVVAGVPTWTHSATNIYPTC
jgi:hypothetical protein